MSSRTTKVKVVLALSILAALSLPLGVANAAPPKPRLPKAALKAKIDHAPPGQSLPRHPRRARARMAIRYMDGYYHDVGFRCDAAYRYLTGQSATNLPNGYAYYMAYVYDYNTGRYVYTTNWIAGNTWTSIARRSSSSPFVNAAIWVKYARWVPGSGWAYASEWATAFSQDDVPYSGRCVF